MWGPGQGSGVCLGELYGHSQRLRIQTGMGRGKYPNLSLLYPPVSYKHFLLVEPNLKSEVEGDAICRSQALRAGEAEQRCR